MNSKVDLNVRLRLNRKPNKREMKQLIAYIAVHILDDHTDRGLYGMKIESKNGAVPLNVEHHFVTERKRR